MFALPETLDEALHNSLSPLLQRRLHALLKTFNPEYGAAKSLATKKDKRESRY
jgi:hypothetical protein